MQALDLADLDLKHNWHPCSQMKDYEIFKPLLIQAARGSYLELADGKKIIDAISSWWCKSLGHAHPRLQKAIHLQIEKFEHVIFANTTNDTIALLSAKLAQLTPSLKKIFYAGDGSCAVEIAMKMSLHARQLTQQFKKTKFMALSNGYHGETTGALSVSDIGLYKAPYKAMLFDVFFIPDLPYVTSQTDTSWHNAKERFEYIERLLEPHVNETTALIVEPIVQGAGGMKIYSQDFLKRLRNWAKAHDIHFIADEIMTGMGRTGKMLACEHADIQPDFLCLAKGLNAGWMPFSAVLTHEKMYAHFYDDHATGKAFLHSHTYSGNALAASIALEVFAIFEETALLDHVSLLNQHMAQAMHDIATTGCITNVRHIGAIVAADLVMENAPARLGFEVYQRAVALGALLRPLGNTIYWLPPLNTSLATIAELKEITQLAIQSVIQKKI